MSGQRAFHVLVHLTWGAVLPVSVTFSLWLLRTTFIHSVSWHDGWHLHPLCNHSLAHYCFFFLHFAWEQNLVHSRAKNNLDNHLCDVWCSLRGKQVIRRPGMSHQHVGGNTGVTSATTCVPFWEKRLTALSCIFNTISPQLHWGWCRSWFDNQTTFRMLHMTLAYVNKKTRYWLKSWNSI